MLTLGTDHHVHVTIDEPEMMCMFGVGDTNANFAERATTYEGCNHLDTGKLITMT